MAVQDYEKLGAFYLGRPIGPDGRTEPAPLLYDSADLTTHAAVIGMTGSGKTGLCLDLLEEAAIDGIPAILVDPKGDLGNLLLGFPNLSGADFAPWVDPDAARRAGLDTAAFAERQAQLWRDGLAKWDIAPDRIARLREAADFAIYTPGSSAGLPVSILKGFAAPPDALRDDADLYRERVSATATNLLALLGLQGDPLRSREHILLARLIDSAWTEGRDVDLAGLIQSIQTPPFQRVGALDLEGFFPAKDRTALASQLNSLLAAPGFEAWLEGAPLDIDAMLYDPAGRPRHVIFSIAHLGDAERMFFVTLLLNEIVAWMRRQSGTGSLRALFYMDEIFGYLPPVANPPSKLPMLTLLKQARAFGLGLVLATQNPVDLDYKALSNIGSWFIGRLQTERDKARVLDGLEGAAGGAFDRAAMDRLLSGLGNRVFLLNNVHEDGPVLFETRWAMSYLRGPLTRSQIKQLMDPRRSGAAGVGLGAAAGVGTAAPAPAAPSAPPRAAAAAAEAAAPVLPPEIRQLFLPVRGLRPEGATLAYRPMLLGVADVRYADKGLDAPVTERRLALTPLQDRPLAADWQRAEPLDAAVDDLEPSARPGAAFAPLPSAAAQARSYRDWSRGFADWLYASATMTLLASPDGAVRARPGESERDFRIRLADHQRAARDAQAEALRRRYAPKLATLQERLRKAEQAVAKEQEQARSAGMEAALAVGGGLLGALFGRKALSVGNLGRTSSALRGGARAYRETQDIARAQENVATLTQQIADLDAEFQAELAGMAAGAGAELRSTALRPRKSDIDVKMVALAWAPYWRGADGGEAPAWG